MPSRFRTLLVVGVLLSRGVRCFKLGRLTQDRLVEHRQAELSSIGHGSGVANTTGMEEGPRLAPAASGDHHDMVRKASITEVRYRIFLLCAIGFAFLAGCWLVYALSGRRRSEHGTENCGDKPTVYMMLACASWIAMSVGLCNMNKSLIMSLKAPALVTIAQMVIAAVLMGATCVRKLFASPRKQLLYWLFIPCLYAGVLCTALYALNHISLSANMALRTLLPLIGLPVEMALAKPEQRPNMSATVLFFLVLPILGVYLYLHGIPSISGIGVVYAFLNICVVLVDRLVQRRLLTNECKDLDSTVCTFMNNTLGCLPCIVLALSTGEVKELWQAERQESWQDPSVLVLLAISGFAGIGICYFGLECQRLITATSFFVMQNLAKVCTVISGVVFFGDPVSSWQAVVGLILCIFGASAYSYVTLKGEQAAPAKKMEILAERTQAR
jgi:drug/metabolite transporter (DMT)-like permease